MTKEKIKNIARWTSLAPGAALAGWLVWVALQALARVTLWAMNLDSESVAGRAYVETLSGLLAGLVFLYVGIKIAPARRRRVAYVLGGAALLGAGFVLFPALARADYWLVWNVACAIVGAAVVAAAVSEDAAARAHFGIPPHPASGKARRTDAPTLRNPLPPQEAGGEGRVRGVGPP